MEDFPLWLKLIIYVVVAGTLIYGLFGFVQFVLSLSRG